jgi:hypothetical protein
MSQLNVAAISEVKIVKEKYIYKHSRALLQKWCGKPFPRPMRLLSGSVAIQANRKKLAPCMKSNMVTSSTFMPYSCHIRATSFGIKWISMVCNGVRFHRIDDPCHQFTRDEADLRS